MKRFNITTSCPIILGQRLPKNTVYGAFPTSYYTTRKVYDKNGNVHKKSVRHEIVINYYITEYENIHNDVASDFVFHVYDEKTKKWSKTDTSRNKLYSKLKDFVAPLIRNNVKVLCADYDSVKLYIPNSMLPTEKKAQVISDSVFNTQSIGYALNSHIMTDDVVTAPRRHYVGYTDNDNNKKYKSLRK